MADSPDWEVTTSAVSVTATKLTSGLDAAKSASPTVGDVYLATDTLILYVCVAAGSWTGFDASILVQGTLLLALIPNLPASRITSERFPMAQMPDGTLNQVIKGAGAGVDPAYGQVQYSELGGIPPAPALQGQVSITGGSVSGGLQATFTASITGLLTTHKVIAFPNASLGGGIVPVAAWCSVNGTLSVIVANFRAEAGTAETVNWTYVAY